jgi:hypothetical protein
MKQSERPERVGKCENEAQAAEGAAHRLQVLVHQLTQRERVRQLRLHHLTRHVPAPRHN